MTHPSQDQAADAVAVKPRVILADDHTLLLEALVCLLADEFALTTVSDGSELIALATRSPPDLVVLDLTMPHITGIEALRVLTPQLPATRFLVLTMHTDRGYLLAAFAAGAHGYVVKDASPEELCAAIRAVLRGERVISPGLGETAQTLGTPRPATRVGSGELTPRQREMVRRITAGQQCKQIAAELGISAKTVEFHKASIARQLGIHSTAELTRWAITHGLAQPSTTSRRPAPDDDLVAAAGDDG